MTRPSFTIGIEEEYQTIDPVTRDLRSHIDAEIIAKGKMQLKEAVKAEMHQSVVEVGTGICTNIQQAREEVRQLRAAIITLARETDCASPHPAPILSQIGGSRKFIPTNATTSSSRI